MMAARKGRGGSAPDTQCNAAARWRTSRLRNPRNSYSHMAMQMVPTNLTRDVAELRRRLGAPPELVFAAFADPALVRRWLTPSPDVRLDVLSFDFRVGGGYRFAYHVPGGAIMHVNGVFRTIERPSQ